jgi:hypothetical protein
MGLARVAGLSGSRSDIRQFEPRIEPLLIACEDWRKLRRITQGHRATNKKALISGLRVPA